MALAVQIGMRHGTPYLSVIGYTTVPLRSFSMSWFRHHQYHRVFCSMEPVSYLVY